MVIIRDRPLILGGGRGGWAIVWGMIFFSHLQVVHFFGGKQLVQGYFFVKAKHTIRTRLVDSTCSIFSPWLSQHDFFSRSFSLQIFFFWKLTTHPHPFKKKMSFPNGLFRVVLCLYQNKLKRVFVRNHSYGNVFHLHVHFHANQTHFLMKGFAPSLVSKQRHKVTRTGNGLFGLDWNLFPVGLQKLHVNLFPYTGNAL